jgi:hypothetical protein
MEHLLNKQSPVVIVTNHRHGKFRNGGLSAVQPSNALKAVYINTIQALTTVLCPLTLTTLTFTPFRLATFTFTPLLIKPTLPFHLALPLHFPLMLTFPLHFPLVPFPLKPPFSLTRTLGKAGNRVPHEHQKGQHKGHKVELHGNSLHSCNMLL